MKLSLDAKILRQINVTETELDDELIVLSVETGKLYSMEDVAKDIWRATVEPVTVGGIVEQLVGTYAVERETCAREVLDFVEHLAEGGLIRISE